MPGIKIQFEALLLVPGFFISPEIHECQAQENEYKPEAIKLKK
jgi:hypothetical protein